MKKLIIALVASIIFVGPAWSITTLQFRTKYADRLVVDLGASGASMGDLVTGHGDVMGLKGDVIGAFYVYTLTTWEKGGTEVKFVKAEYAFGDGIDTFNIEGVGEYVYPNGLAALNRPLYFAVTGGTGKYSGARGGCQVERITNTDHVVTCKFTTMKIKF